MGFYYVQDGSFDDLLLGDISFRSGTYRLSGTKPWPPSHYCTACTEARRLADLHQSAISGGDFVELLIQITASICSGSPGSSAFREFEKVRKRQLRATSCDDVAPYTAAKSGKWAVKDLRSLAALQSYHPWQWRFARSYLGACYDVRRWGQVHNAVSARMQKFHQPHPVLGLFLSTEYSSCRGNYVMVAFC